MSDLETRSRSRLQVGLQTVILAVAGCMGFGGSYPPAHAQYRDDYQTAQAVRNSEAKMGLDEVNKRLDQLQLLIWKAIDDRNKAIEVTNDRIRVLDLQMASLLAEERIVGSVIGILAASSIVVTIRSKKA